MKKCFILIFIYLFSIKKKKKDSSQQPSPSELKTKKSKKNKEDVAEKKIIKTIIDILWLYIIVLVLILEKHETCECIYKLEFLVINCRKR